MVSVDLKDVVPGGKAILLSKEIQSQPLTEELLAARLQVALDEALEEGRSDSERLKARVAELEASIRTSIAAQERMTAGYERAEVKARDKENELVRIRAEARSLTHLVGDGEDVLTSICGKRMNPLFSDLDLTADIERVRCAECLKAVAISQNERLQLLSDTNARLDAKLIANMGLLKELAAAKQPEDVVPGRVERAPADYLPAPTPHEPNKGFFMKLLGRGKR